MKASRPQLADAARRAFAAFAQGRHEEAEIAARVAIGQNPRNSAALEILGLVLAARQRSTEALHYLQRALTLAPAAVPLRLRVIATMQQAGRPREALMAARRARELAPNDPNCHAALGVCLRDLGQTLDAEAALRGALALDPKHTFSLVTLGEMLACDPQRTEDARVLLEQARGLNPDDARIAARLNTLRSGTAAIPPVSGTDRRTCAPGQSPSLGRVSPASEWVQRGLHILPGDPEAAEQCFRNALSVQANHSDAAYHWATIRAARHDAPAVLGLLRTHHESLVTSGRALDLYVWALQTLNRDEEALTQLVQFGNREGLSPVRWLTYYRLALRCAEWRHWESIRHTLIEPLLVESPPGAAWAALAMPFGPGELLRLARAQAREVSDHVGPPLPALALSEEAVDTRPVRLGYLCGDIREHPTMHLSGRMFGKHDRTRFRVHVYDVGTGDDSHWASLVRDSVAVYRSLNNAPARGIAEQIREDRIDILVDLGGYSRGGRPDVLALRPAPIQAHWFVMPGTSGAPWVDYFIADPQVVDASLRPHFSENIAFLPDCYMPTDQDQPIAADDPGRRREGLPESAVVFCCFNQAYKITPEVFARWLELLRAVPDSVLWLIEGAAVRRRNLALHARRAGVDPARLVYARWLDKPNHLARLQLADLCLDTDIYGGHTTTIDALWAGRPVLTVAGHTFAARATASMLKAMHLGDLVCDNWTEYRDRAIQLAQQPEQLRALQARVEANRLHSPLFDNTRQMRHLESLLEKMLERHRNNEPPADIHLF